MSGAFGEVAHFVPAITPPEVPEDASDWWFVVRDETVLLVGAEQSPEIPRARHPLVLGVSIEKTHFLGLLDGRRCWATAATGPPEGANAHWSDLRSLFSLLPDDLLAVAGRAMQVVAWDRNHRFCGRCGTPTAASTRERARKCPDCGLMAFPRISPAVIVLIHRDGKMLLARSARFTTGMYGLIAGFVEPGESLEDAARREIMEEIGVTVGDLSYVASQPWPFPNSLMVGFTAQWASGEITPDPSEIEDAQWFHPSALPLLPSKISIARRLIDDFLARN
ncbi:MAG: NAD(+) diphosphatase [Thermomicrobiales bacterium]